MDTEWPSCRRIRSIPVSYTHLDVYKRQVSTVNDAGTHGNFLAQGTLSVPLFREAKLHGDIEAAQAQMESVNQQLADLRTHIEQQIRVALLDVDATRQLVDVARSNVELATRTVSDETDRVNAGVDDNLPLVEAQSSLASVSYTHLDVYKRQI